MKKNKIIKIIIFNICLVLIDIILFSEGLIGLKINDINVLKKSLAITLIFMNVICFIYINYKLLNSKAIKHDYNLNKIDNNTDYVNIISKLMNKKYYNNLLKLTLEQLNRINKKQKSLDYMLFQKFGEEENGENFKKAIKDISESFFKNIKKIINIVSIFDQEEYNYLLERYKTLENIPIERKQLYEENDKYLKEIIKTNEEILLILDKLLIEMSKIGDIQESDEINIENMKDIINSMKTLREF